MQVPHSEVLEHLAENPVVSFVELRLRHSVVAELLQRDVNVRESEIMHEKSSFEKKKKTCRDEIRNRNTKLCLVKLKLKINTGEKNSKSTKIGKSGENSRSQVLIPLILCIDFREIEQGQLGPLFVLLDDVVYKQILKVLVVRLESTRQNDQQQILLLDRTALDRSS